MRGTCAERANQLVLTAVRGKLGINDKTPYDFML